MQIDVGNYSINTCEYDRTGNSIAVGCDDGLIKIFNESTGKLDSTLKGHEDSV